MKIPKKIVVVGVTDSGKSTFMGHYLSQCGAFTDKELREATRVSVERHGDKDTQRWAFTYLLDVFEEERDRGITTEFFQKEFTLVDGEERKDECVMVDSPGHVMFMDQMVQGAQDCQTAFFLVSCKKNETENSLKDVEHLHILKCLGIQHLLILLNKVDLVMEDPTVQTPSTVLDVIKHRIETLVKPMKFRSVSFLPVSALTGNGFGHVTKYILELPQPLRIPQEDRKSSQVEIRGLALTTRPLSIGFECAAHLGKHCTNTEVIGVQDAMPEQTTHRLSRRGVFTKKGRVYILTLSLSHSVVVSLGLPVILRVNETLFIARISKIII